MSHLYADDIELCHSDKCLEIQTLSFLIDIFWHQAVINYLSDY